jgi:protein phosphatase
MGTTVTAAYVGDDAVVVAHVGDSRCYLLRDGDLIRLTRDHSLVDELIRRGKLTEEQAESHPQRSVITRALGPEPTVEVDVEAFPARDGDVFLLCSDGLTSMVHDPKLKPLLTDGERTLEQTGRALIAAANEAGGRDNITVVLFRLEDVGGRRAAAAEDAAQTAEYDTFSGEAAPRPGLTRPMTVSDEAEADYRRHGTVALQAVRGERRPRGPGSLTGIRPEGETRARAEPEEGAPPPPPPERTMPLPGDGTPKRRRRKRSGGLTLLMLAIVLPLCVGAWLATRAVYFIGVDPGAGQAVTIYRGLPYELPFGVDLYEEWFTSGVPLSAVPDDRRAKLLDHQLRSRDDAEDLVNALEKGQVE